MGKKSVKERIRYRRENAVDPEAYLQEVGAIQPSADDDLEFTPSFESRVGSHVETFREEGVDEGVIAGIFGVDEAEVEIPDRPYTAFKIDFRVHSWPSEDSLVLDAAVDAALREVAESWDEVPPRQRYRVLQSLRSFQDDCLFCNGEVLLSEEAVESCCSERQVLTVHCEVCDRRFLEFTAEQDPSTDDTVRV